VWGVDFEFDISRAAHPHVQAIVADEFILRFDVTGAGSFDPIVRRGGHIYFQVAGGEEIETFPAADGDDVAVLFHIDKMQQVVIAFELYGGMVAGSQIDVGVHPEVQGLEGGDGPVVRVDIPVAMDSFATQSLAGAEEER
jgi:hypothetical protein